MCNPSFPYTSAYNAPSKTEALYELLIQQAGLSLSAPPLVLQHTDDAAKNTPSKKKNQKRKQWCHSNHQKQPAPHKYYDLTL